uniref:hypothetical protein n=1 Tax=Ningiella ruwaisensis TaxID=2364274 RepID=UPI00109F5615|nr:hypothetical protein [Ningiella ruwaisensis]
MAILAVKSLLRFVNMSVVFHGDESLDKDDMELIQRHIKNAKVYSIEDADKIAKETSEQIFELRKNIGELFQLDQKFEKQKKAWALKVLDFHLLSSAPKVIVLDSDTLFFKPPTQIIEWTRSSTTENFYAIPVNPNLKIDQQSYSAIFPNASFLSRFNGGLFGFNKNMITLESVIDIIETLKVNRDYPVYGDECIWRLVFAHTKTVELSFDEYPLIGSKESFNLYKSKDAVKYMHFLLKHRQGVYAKSIDQVVDEINAQTT